MVWNKVQFIDIFPQTSNGQKPVDMFLANLKTVDMFLEAKVRTGGIVDMFLTAILRTGTKNDYLFRFLVPRRDGSIDVKERHIRPSKVLEVGAFQVFGHQCRGDNLTVKIALSGHINCSGCRVEQAI